MLSSKRKLNPLLKLAAISGVQSAIKFHIQRGDDLDAPDSSGATPLILAASKKKVAAVRLLLDAGADPLISDKKGMDALAHAIDGGCHMTINLLKEAMARVPPIQHPSNTISESIPIDESTVAIVSLDEEPLGELFFNDWEAEEEPLAPEGDGTIIDAARQANENIALHKAINGDEGWEDIDLHLPVRAAPLVRNRGAGIIRDFFLLALREKAVPENELIEICLDNDGSRNLEAERLLTLVAGELGASIVEWVPTDNSHQDTPTEEEELLLIEAEEFAEDLASDCNNTLRAYLKDIRGGLRVELLEAEEEIALSREMEDAWRAALSALAQWPAGLSALKDEAAQVALREVDHDIYCVGSEPSLDDASSSLSDSTSTGTDEEEESVLSHEAAYFISAVASLDTEKSDFQSTLQALESAPLTRSVLLKLATKATQDVEGIRFAEALRRQTAARERMILANLRLAVSIAKKYRWSSTPFEDLIQEANIGLMKAVERFDWRRGFRFSTYATWWIRQQISRGIADKSRVVRAPVHIQEEARRVLQEKEQIEVQLGRMESLAEAASRIGASCEKTATLLSMFEEAISLEETAPFTGLPRMDSLLINNDNDQEELAEHSALQKCLQEILEELDERSRQVIQMRFGLLDDNSMTLEEVGQHFGVTRERIRQIESKAMRKLRQPRRFEVLWPFMGCKYEPRSQKVPERITRPSNSAVSTRKAEDIAANLPASSVACIETYQQPVLDFRKLKMHTS